MAIFSYTVNHTAVAVRKWQRVNKSSMKSEKICLVPQRFACRCPILPRQSNLGFSFFSQVSKNKYAMCGLKFQIKAGWEAFQLTVAVWLWKPKPLGKDSKKFRMLLASLLVVLRNKLATCQQKCHQSTTANSLCRLYCSLACTLHLHTRIYFSCWSKHRHWLKIL